MTNESIYEIWRPENSPWSKWVKPVIFPFLTPGDHGRDAYSVPEWRVPLDPDTAIIADLPGAEGVSTAIALARAGYRPVLVYNACPAATYEGASTKFASPLAVVDMSSILSAICAATMELASLPLSAQSPTAFLLDRNRDGVGIPYGPGWFDNRSFVTPSDFPSADDFSRHRISKVILLQASRHIKPDLLQVLLRLQREGMTISTQTPWQPWSPTTLTVKPLMFIISAWEWLRRKFDYRRESFHGSFGGLVPPSSS